MSAAPWGAIAAMDSLKVVALSLRGPLRYAVLVVMDLQSRRVQIAGIVREPYKDWMFQVLLNLIDSVDGFLSEMRLAPWDHAVEARQRLGGLLNPYDREAA